MAVYRIRNIGSAPAFNVWLVVPEFAETIGLGSLDTHEARVLPWSVVGILNGAATGRHILLAAARPGPRPYTVTFNTRATESTFRHGFDEDPPDDRLKRKGPVNKYLEKERDALLVKLDTFASF